MGMGMIKGQLRSTVAAALMLTAVAPALAQVSPGQVRDTLPTPAPRPATAPPRVSTPTPTPAPASPSLAPLTVSLQAISFEGNTTFPDAVLEPLVQPYLNRPLSLADIYAAADAVERFHAERGYPLVSVVVPPQKITVGRVTMQVIEATVGEIRFEGLRRYRPAQLRAILPVTPGEPYTQAPLEQGLFRLNDLPGLQARAVIRPGAAFGTSDIVVRARETAMAGSLTLDQHGRDAIGEFRLTGRMQLNNPLRLGDALTLTVLASEDALLTYGAVGYSVPINRVGTRLEAYFGQAAFETDVLAPIDGTSREARIGFRHPVSRSHRWSLDLTGGYTDLESDTDLLGTTFSGTEIQLFDIGLQANHRGAGGANSRLAVVASTDFDEQTRAGLNPGGNGVVEGHQRLRLQLSAHRHQPLAPNWALLLRADAIYSPDPLVDTQAFGLGGPGTVRGYPASEFRGDQGIVAGIDVARRFTMPGGAFIPRVFVDGGTVRRLDLPAGADDRDSISSAGIGVDLHLSPASLSLDWAFPLQDRVVSDGENVSRVYGTLSVHF